MDWAGHLEYLQTIFREFDANAVISEPVLIRLFRNGLRPSIFAQAKKEGCQKNTLDQAIKKAITAEAKAALNLLLWVREMDACCPKGYYSALKPIKDHTRDRASLSFRFQEARAMPSHRSKPTKTKRPCQDHQKGRHNRNCRDCSPCGSRPQSSTSATGVNTTKILARNDCGRNQLARQEDKDLNRLTCYNCNKKGYFANQCPKPCKPKN